MLTLLGLDFDVEVPGVEELEAGEPRVLVLENARRKAREVAARHSADRTVLAADTDVVVDGRVLGKPKTPEGARERLELLAARTHLVHGGIVLIGSGREELSEVIETAVTFRALGAVEIDAYVGSGEWRGRAGGYAVQGLGSALIERVEGDLSNVIGLPVPALCRMIGKLQER